MRNLPLNLILFFGILLSIFISLSLGSDGNNLLFSQNAEEQKVGMFILLHLRLPRTILALITGAALGLSGTVLQGYFRNPLAEPSILGVSSLAAFGAVLAIYTGLYQAFPYALPVMAMAAASLAPVLFYLLAKREWQSKTIILIGIAISSFVGALTTLFLNLMDRNYALLEIIFWMFGSFSDRTYGHILLILPFVICGAGLLLMQGRQLDVLALGEETAHSMGVSLPRLSLTLIAGVVLLVGSVVSVTGVIGFIGLVVPHMLRLWMGERPRQLLIPSILGGGILALLSDILVRLLPTTGELKVGVVTALIGVPIFIHIIRRKKHASI